MRPDEESSETAAAPRRTSHGRGGGFLLALLPLLAFAAFAVFTALGAYRAADEARLRATAGALAAAVEARIAVYVAAMETLAQSPLLDDPRNAEAFGHRARLVAERLGGAIVLVGPPPGLRMLANTHRLPGAPLPSAWDGDSEAQMAAVFASGLPTISDLFLGPLTARWMLAARVPVDRPGQPRRVLVLSMEPATLQALLAGQLLPPRNFALIADGNMNILARSPDPDGQHIGAQAPGWVTGAIAGQRRSLVIGPGLDGREHVYAAERLASAPGWTVAVAEPVAVQQASAWGAVRWLLAGGGALALGVAIVVWAGRREAVQLAQREAAALREGRTEVERLLGGLPAVIFLRGFAPGGASRLLYRGGDIEQVTGWPPATFAAQDNFQAWVDLELAEYDAFFARVAREGEGSIDYRMRQPDGTWRPLRVRCRLLARREDGGCDIVGYIRDISAEHMAEARALAAARLASLGEMAGGLAHEIKQPLQSISLSAELAQLALRQGRAAQADARLEQVVEQAQRTADMVDRLRRFARGGEEGTAPEAVPVGAAVEGALQLVDGALREAGIGVVVALGEPAPVVLGHALLLEQVLSNLLLNARDALAARPAGAVRQVRIAAANGAEGMVLLSVADTGGGIAPHIMARLFEPFVTSKRPEAGTGLGLSICHGLVKGMGGRMEARNDGEGAVFTILLPSPLAPAG